MSNPEEEPDGAVDEPQQNSAVGSVHAQVGEDSEKTPYAAIDRFVPREAGALQEGTQIPAIAFRLLPAPDSVQKHLGPICPNGYYDLMPSNAAQQAIADKLHTMTDAEDAALKHTFMQWYESRQGIRFDRSDGNDGTGGYSPDSLLTTGGTASNIHSLLEIFDEENGGNARISTITPTYPPILGGGTKFEGRVSTVAMDDTEDGWKLNMQKLKETIVKSDVFILCNPANPNGYVFSPEELAEIVSACKEDGVKIIADEVWNELVDESKSKFTSVATVAAREGYTHGVITLNGVGKIFGTAAFPCSTAIIEDPKVRAAFEEKQSKKDLSDPFDQPKPSKEAANAAIDCMQTDGADYIKQLNGLVQANIAYAVPILNKLGFKTHAPAGTSVLFAKVSAPVNEGEIKKANALFEAAGIEVSKSQGARYGMPGYVRLNMGVPTAMVKERYGKLAQLMHEAA